VATGSPAADRLTGLTVLVPQDMDIESLSAVAYFLIRDLIVTLELAPGTPLREKDLMERLALGRTPVREALHRLADEGLVAIYARRGMAVASVDVGELSSVSEVRVELEGLAARLAAQRGSDADQVVADRLVAEIDKGLDPADPRALIRLDQRVHHCMHQAAHNHYLESTLDEYLALSLRLWFLGLDQVSRLDESVAEHRDLLTAIMDSDVTAAEKVARAHVAGFWDEIRRVIAT
jgi:DNA-binding GntR family transcriptional regulator